LKVVDVSVNLCTFNRLAMLRHTLDSLLAQKTDGTFTYEIVIIDDGSTDATPLFVQHMVKVSRIPIRYFREERVGVAAARSRGVKESWGEWIAFIDDDEIAETDWLQNLKTVATENDADCVGGEVKLIFLGDADRSIEDSVRRQIGETSPLGWFQRRFTYSGPGTGNALVRRNIFEKLGHFDSSLEVRGEDQDFFRRARKAGYKIVFPSNALVYHLTPMERLSPNYLFILAQQNGKSLAYFDCRYLGYSKAGLICGLRIANIVLKAFNVALRTIFKQPVGSLFGLKCSAYATLAYCKETMVQIRERC
jgi:GT2 family glycosyltransferase